MNTGAIAGAGIVVLGLALGAGGTLLMRGKHPAPPAHRVIAYATASARPTVEPSPRTDILSIPSGKRRASQSMFASSSAEASPRVETSVAPSASPTVAATSSPSPLPTSSPEMTPSPRAALVSTPHPTMISPPPPRPTPTAKPQPSAVPTPVVTPSAKPRMTPKPHPVVAHTPGSAAESVVHRYLHALMRGDETTAYRLLGGAPGQKGLSLSEEAFITRDAHIAGLVAQPVANGTNVQAEVSTATGLYVATYHVETRNGQFVITSHDYIKP